jgi:hypothetical protein
VSRYIDAHRGRFGVEPICRTLDVSASAYYQRASGQRSERVIEDERLLGRIREVHAANYYCYGYRRTWKALLRAGEPVGRDHVRRLMRAHGIQGAKRRGKPWRTTIADPAATRSPDRVNRDFTANRPDALWVADFTYVRCYEGMVFFSFVIDVFSRRIVGWQFASHMRTDLVLDALRMALTRRQHGADVDLICPASRNLHTLARWRWGGRCVVGVGEVALDGAVTVECLVRSDRVVELAECFDHRRHLCAVGGQVAPERFDLDRAVVALDDAVGLR